MKTVKMTKNNTPVNLYDFTPLTDFAMKGRAVHSFGGYSLTRYDYYLFIIKSNLIYGTEPRYEENIDLEDIKEDISAATSYAPCGIIIKKGVVLMNGDTPYYEHSDDINDPPGVNLPGMNGDWPTISFTCLGRLMNTNAIAAAKAIASGRIKVVGYTTDERRPLTEAQKKQKPSNLVPPEQGFTLVGNDWHRSGTVILHDSKVSKTYLLGQDEGSYFGCILADNPKSIKAAFTSLTPKVARGIPNVKRQGEWFLVPVASNKVPKIEECVAACVDNRRASDVESGSPEDNRWNGFALPVTDEDSSRHVIVSEDIRVAKNGQIYALSPTLVHSRGEHINVFTTEWVTFHCNTAIRSVSVLGVD